jgi:hypothetical protein
LDLEKYLFNLKDMFDIFLKFMRNQKESYNELILEIEVAIQQIIDSEIPEENIIKHFQIFQKGIQPVILQKPCTVNDGISKFNSDDELFFQNKFREYKKNHDIIKFVPASGAATRMFKELLNMSEKFHNLSKAQLENIFLNNKEAAMVNDFFTKIKDYPFYEKLDNIMNFAGYNLDDLIESGDYSIILDFLLNEKGLNYRSLPKGLIEFHKYETETRTPFHEHIIEAINYSVSGTNNVRIHFTVQEEYKNTIQNYLDNIIANYTDNHFDISLSIQKKSTNTIAVDENNLAFLDKSQKYIFRPGGHGALIENLNEIDSDLIFIKNIDNVVPDGLKAVTYKYKEVLAGYCIELKESINQYVIYLLSDISDNLILDEIELFVKDKLNFQFLENYNKLPKKEKKNYLLKILDRPLRVCGMVKNQGEPGGGPFFIIGNDGSISLQIIESAQIDSNNPEQIEIFRNSTHFNPVDIVCMIKNYRGDKYNLKDFINDEMAFITVKSKDGKELKALELPGLWNGAMANWNTAFIEVPIITFNPVKTVFDLLRREHSSI